MASGAPLEVVIKPELEDAAVLTYWVGKKDTLKQLVHCAEKAAVLVPFWILANVAAHRGAEEGAEPSGVKQLEYATACVPVLAVALMAKGIRSTGRQDIKVRILYATNSMNLNKGDRIQLREGVPGMLPK